MSVKIGQIIDDFEVIKYLGKTKKSCETICSKMY